MNEKKTQVLAIPASTGQDIQLNVTCNGVHLGQTDTAKYLGVVMDERLSWSGHVSSIVRKVSGKLVSLWKIRQVLSESVMKHLYKSLLVPDILYCSNAYYPGLPAVAKNTLLRLTKRCLRCVANAPQRTPTAHLLHRLGLQPLEFAATEKLTVLMYRIANHQVSPKIAQRLEKLSDHPGLRTRGSVNNSFKVPEARRTSGTRRPLFRGVLIWNSLLPVLRALPSLKGFKKHLREHLLTIDSS